MSSPSRNTKNYLWWIPNIVVSQNNLTVPVKNISWLPPIASQEVEMKQYNFTNNQFVLLNPGSLGRCHCYDFKIYARLLLTDLKIDLDNIYLNSNCLTRLYFFRTIYC